MSSYGEIEVSQIASIMPSSTTMQSGATSNGDGANLDVQGYTTAVVSVSGGFSATINFEVSVDDITWVPILAVESGATTVSSTTTIAGGYSINVAGFKSLRARISGYSSGSITVEGVTTVMAGAASGSTDQGSAANNINDAWYVSGSSQVLQQDSFNKLVISNSVTIFTSKEDLQQQTYLWSTLTATGGTIVYDSTTSSNSLNVTTSSGSRAARQSKTHLPYSPGKGALVLLTGVVGSGQTNTTKRLGLYNDSNGLFFELVGTTKQVVVRNNTVDTAVASTSWNIDPFDGTGPSGITIDWTKIQIFYISFQWLGAGRVVFGFSIDGKNYPCHQILNANSAINVYMQTPVLPIRYEIVNTGAAVATATLKQICSTAQINSGLDDWGCLYSCSNSVTTKSVNALTPVLILRPKSTVLNPPFRMKSIEIITTSNSNIYWQLVVNPTFTGGTPASYSSVNTTSYFEFDVASTATVSGGMVLRQGYISSQGRASLNLDVGFDTNLIGSDISGIRDTLCLAAYTLGGGASNMYGSMNWLEFI